MRPLALLLCLLSGCATLTEKPRETVCAKGVNETVCVEQEGRPLWQELLLMRAGARAVRY